MAQLPPDLEQQVKDYLASGQYRTAEDVVREAFRALADEQTALGDIRHGIEDLDAGRGRPLSDIDAEIRKKHNISRDA